MTLAEKHKIKAEEKKLEKEEARAKFRLNQIKPTTNACFNILFVLLSFVCLFPVFYVFMISVSSTDSITKYGYRLFPDTYSTAAYTFLWNERGTLLHLDGVHPDDLQWRYGCKLCGCCQYAALEQYNLVLGSAAGYEQF